MPVEYHLLSKELKIVKYNFDKYRPVYWSIGKRLGFNGKTVNRMKVDKSVLITFPRDGPIATAGAFLHNEQLLITGHANGLVLLWNLKDGTSRKLYSCSDVIQTIAWRKYYSGQSLEM